MSVEWTPNPDGVKELLSSPQAVNALGEIAAMAGQQVQRAMPSTRQARAISTTAGVENGVAVGVIATDSPIWHLLEYGSAKNPAYRPFARGVQAAGLDYEPLPR